VCRVNGSNAGDRIVASDDVTNQAKLVLEGGGGEDKYYFAYGSGDDKINDSGENQIFWADENGKYHEVGNVYKNATDVCWSTIDGVTQFTKDSVATIVLEDGSTIELGSDFEDGDFGIRLIDIPDNPITTNTIVGDQDLGNVNDELGDTAANDRIEGLTGDDYIESTHGGNDWLLGGDGSDMVISQNSAGKDILEGNEDSDILWGGPDDDKMFGGDYGEMETLIAEGETAEGINEKGDLASGGAGDDVILGDDEFTYAIRNWGFSLVRDGWSHSFTTSGIDRVGEAIYGDDVIYAGAGNDFVSVGGGGDEYLILRQQYRGLESVRLLS
jgi:Ca2+-binding RTX toxin-like protein